MKTLTLINILLLLSAVSLGILYIRPSRLANFIKGFILILTALILSMIIVLQNR